MNRRTLLQAGCALAGGTAGGALLGSCAPPPAPTAPATMTSDAAAPPRRFGANVSMMFADAPLLERFDRAAAAGFRGVELQFPYAETAEDLARRARAAGVEVALVNVPVFAGGETALSATPGAEAAFRDAVATARRYAETLEADAVNVLSGAAAPGVARETQIATYRANLAYAAEVMSAAGVRVVAEPVNPLDRPGTLVTTPDEMAAVFDGVDRDDLFIQFDIYHVVMTGHDPIAEYEKHAARVGHIQFADVPGRHEPGSGAIDFAAVFDAINAAGYGGWINAEYEPAGRTEAGLGWLDSLARPVA